MNKKVSRSEFDKVHLELVDNLELLKELLTFEPYTRNLTYKQRKELTAELNSMLRIIKSEGDCIDN